MGQGQVEGCGSEVLSLDQTGWEAYFQDPTEAVAWCQVRAEEGGCGGLAWRDGGSAKGGYWIGGHSGGLEDSESQQSIFAVCAQCGAADFHSFSFGLAWNFVAERHPSFSSCA